MPRLIACLLLLLTTLGQQSPVASAGEPQGRARIDVLVVRGREPVPARLELRRLEGLLDLVMAQRSWLASVNVEASRTWLARQDTRPVVARAEASAEGRGSFEGLGPGLYEVVARAGEQLDARSLVALEVAGQHVSTVVRLVGGEVTLEGRLRHADGRPFQGFVVVARPDWRRLAVPCLEEAWERATDAEGRFRVAGLPAGKVTIAALLPDTLRAELGEVQLPLEGAFEGVVPETKGGPVCTVVDLASDRPVKDGDLYVRYADDSAGLNLMRLRTGDGGRVELPILASGATLLCIAPGYAPAYARLRPGATTAPIELEQAARMEGVVLAPDSSPVPGVQIVVAARIPAEDRFTDDVDLIAWTKTDAKGKYALEGLLPTETRAFVRDTTWTSAGSWRQDHGGFTPNAWRLAPGVIHRHAHRVEPAGWMAGQVRDEDGRGVEGALVLASNSDLQFEPVAATDAAGRFRLGGLPGSGHHTLYVVAPDGRWGSRRGLTVGADAADVTIVRAAPRWLEVRVIDGEAGLPIAGAELRVDTSGEGVRHRNRPGIRPRWVTSAEGTAWVGPLWPETLRLGVRVEGHAPLPWPTFEPTTTGPLTLVAGPRTYALAGRILPAQDAPLPPSLRLVRSEPGEPPIGALLQGGTELDVRADGSFRVTGLLPGRYVLRASGAVEDRLFDGQVQAEAGADALSLRLREVSRASPKTWHFLIRSHDGRPVPRATLWVEADALPEDRELEEVAVHAGEVTYTAHDGRVGLLLRVVACDARTLSGRALEVGYGVVGHVEHAPEPTVIELPPERALRGRVIGPDGRPIAGVRLRADMLCESRTDDSAIELATTAVTSDEGTFRLGGLSGDGFGTRLRFDVPEDCARERALWFPYDASVPIEVRLIHAVRGPLRIVDEDGASLSGCLVQIEPDADDFWTFDDNVELGEEGFYSGPADVTQRTDASGTVRFKRLDPRRGYPLFIDPPEERPDLEAVHLPAWRPRAEEETIVLRRVAK